MLHGIASLEEEGRLSSYMPSPCCEGGPLTPVRFFSASSPFRGLTRSTLLPLSQKVKLELPETLLRRGVIMDRFNYNSQAAVRAQFWGSGSPSLSLQSSNSHCRFPGSRNAAGIYNPRPPQPPLLSFFSLRRKPPWNPLQGLGSLSPSHRPAESFAPWSLGAQQQGDRLCRSRLGRVVLCPVLGGT